MSERSNQRGRRPSRSNNKIKPAHSRSECEAARPRSGRALQSNEITRFRGSQLADEGIPSNPTEPKAREAASHRRWRALQSIQTEAEGRGPTTMTTSIRRMRVHRQPAKLADTPRAAEGGESTSEAYQRVERAIQAGRGSEPGRRSGSQHPGLRSRPGSTVSHRR